MIQEALDILTNQLNQYLVSPDEPIVELVNIASFDPTDENAVGFNNKIILSLVNIGEESTLRNGPDFYVNAQNEVKYSNWPVFVNLYLLFSSPCAKTQISYRQSLKRLSGVIEFFQGNRTFNVGELVLPDELAARTDLLDLCISIDLHTLNFEQINDLWGSLGGRQFPFVMYKARLLKLEMERPQGDGALISEIHPNIIHKY